MNNLRPAPRARFIAAAALLCFCFLLSLPSPRAAEPSLRVLESREGEPGPDGMMNRYLTGLMRGSLARRSEALAKLSTPEELRAWQEERKKFFIEQLGGFPERTPLNARTTGRLEFADYAVEKVIFESRPKFFVTAALYLPKGAGRRPGVLFPCGHSQNGKASEAYQRACILLAKNGFAVLCYDPIGQGERNQVLGEDGKMKYNSTIEHTFVGTGAILLGTSAAAYRVWDGIRALDYLESRPEVDPKRLGCTGNSGGGTLTSYLMALDERIFCAVPNCYITSFTRLIETIGAQDAEQNIAGQLAFGMDHADYLIMRAPRPTQIGAATKDFFDIGGSWDSFREAKRFYTKLGASERVDLIEVDTDHGYSQPHREAMVAWMKRWLMGKEEQVVEPEFPVLSDAEMQVTPGGQVLLLEGARSAFDLNRDLLAECEKMQEAFWRSSGPGDGEAKLRAVAQVRPLAELPAASVRAVGAIQRDGYRIEKIVISSEPGIDLPALFYLPDAPTKSACLYLSGAGKEAEAAPGGELEKLVRAGKAVLAADLRGLGETRPTKNAKDGFTPHFGVEWQDFFLAYLLGKNYVGMRAEDALVCARFLREAPALKSAPAAGSPVEVIASGLAAPAALHAAFFEPELFARAELRDCERSWEHAVLEPFAPMQLPNAIHGVLRVYDLPDLKNSAALKNKISENN